MILSRKELVLLTCLCGNSSINAFNTKLYHNTNSILLNKDNKYHNYHDNNKVSGFILIEKERKSRNLITKPNASQSEQETKIPYFFSPVSTVEEEENNDVEIINNIKKIESKSSDVINGKSEVYSVEAINVNELKSNADDDGGSGLLWRGVVVILCALWASNFAAAKLVMGEPGVDSSLYALSRFSVAALALMIGTIAAAKRVGKDMIDFNTAKNAAICGSWVAFGYIGQTLGLLTTTASRSCVICTLHCVFVAIIAEAMRVSRFNSLPNVPNNIAAKFDLTRLIPAAIAVAGVAIVELKGAGGAPTIGDALSFAQPIGFGLGYIQLEELMREKPQAALPVSAIKVGTIAIASFLFFELSPFLINGMALAPRIPDFTPILSSPLALGGILYTGLITTALALWVESIAFKRVPATDASIILTTEPLFAALAGAFTLGETFVTSDYLGAALILGACVFAVLLDDAATDDQCNIEDAAQGKCEPPRTLPISAE